MLSTPLVLLPQMEFQHGRICLIANHPECILIEGYSGYIPKKAFKEIFEAVGDLVAENKTRRAIFDKSRLTVFHQPSMEWYFLDWKERMFLSGLTIHRKILPPSDAFRESARIARARMERDYPDAKFRLMDIKYSPSVEDAISD